MKYLITGATGHLGGMVVTELSKLVPMDELRLGVHRLEKAGALQAAGYEVVALDYTDVDSMTAALTGVDVLVYIPSLTYQVQQRISEFENTLTAMQRANVTTIVAMSFIADQYNNPFQMASYYAYLPARLASSGLNYAVVKNALYADPLVPYLPELIARQNVIYPVGNQAMSFISREDSAEALARIAVQPYLHDHGQNYLLTMKQNYNMVELSAIMSQVTGKQIGYAPVTLQEFADLYRSEGDGDELTSMYHAAALGLMDEVTTDFQHITGHAPQSMTEYLTRHYQK